MFRTKKQIKELLKLVKKYNFNVPTGFWELSIEQIQKAYNGIGADWQGKLPRAIQTQLLSYFEAVSLVHDCVATYFNGHTKEGFKQWNKFYFYDNCTKQRKADFSFWSRERFNKWIEARAIYRVLSRFGFKAWKDAANV